jgi:hypothetical protein
MTVEIWPVIHVSPDSNITLENADIAQRCGCPGVFLISMSGEDRFTDVHAQLIREQFKLKIGVNLLTMSPFETVEHSLAQGYEASWSDYSWRGERESIRRLIEGSNHKFFAAVAMKGETHDEPNPEQSARIAEDHGIHPFHQRERDRRHRAVRENSISSRRDPAGNAAGHEWRASANCSQTGASTRRTGW